MAKTHRLYFLKHLTNNDWNDLYHSSNSFLYSLKNTYLKKTQEDASYKKSKNLIFFETLLEYQDWITTKSEDLENKLSVEIEKIHTLENFNKDLDSFLKQVDDFLAKQKLIEYSSEYEKQNCLLHFYVVKKETTLTDKKFKSVEKILTKKTTSLDSKVTLEKYLFYKKKAGVSKNKELKRFPEYLEKAAGYFNDYYVSNAYKLACASITTILNFKSDVKPTELPQIPESLIRDEISAAYFNSYNILLEIYHENISIIKYSDVENLLKPIQNFDSNTLYSPEDVKILHQIKLGICFFLFPYDKGYATMLKNTIKEMVVKNIFFENNYLDARLYKKILEVYSVSGLQEEAILFFEKYTTELSDEVKEQYLKYCQALLGFSNNAISNETILDLNMITNLSNNQHLYLSIKKLLMKILFDASEFETCQTHLDNTIKYLQRYKKVLPKQNHTEDKNFMSVYRMVLNEKDFDDDFRNALKNKLSSPLHMLDVQWLRQKFLLQSE